MQHTTDPYQDIRDAVRALCAEFPDEYHRKIDEQRGYPEAFVDALTQAGWMAALIPQEYGGSGLSHGRGLGDHGGDQPHGRQLRRLPRPDVRDERHRAQRHRRSRRKGTCPRIATGELRIQSMGVTEPTTGSDTTQLKTMAVKKDGRWVINGQKVWISRIQHSDMMILLARTTPLADVQKRSDGLSCFLIDLKTAIGNGLTVRPILNMVNHETNELFFDNLEIPEENLLGPEGKGFKTILDGLNAERTLIAAECIGDGYWFIDRARKYASERMVFGRPIGQNQGVQFPIADAYIEVEAANLMRWKACELIDAHQPCGRRGQHGQVPGGQGELGSGERLPADARRLRLCLRIRHRAQVPRDPAVPGGADLDQHDLQLRRRACAGLAALVLMSSRAVPLAAGRARDPDLYPIARKETK